MPHRPPHRHVLGGMTVCGCLSHELPPILLRDGSLPGGCSLAPASAPFTGGSRSRSGGHLSRSLCSAGSIRLASGNTLGSPRLTEGAVGVGLGFGLDGIEFGLGRRFGGSLDFLLTHPLLEGDVVNLDRQAGLMAVFVDGALSLGGVFEPRLVGGGGGGGRSRSRSRSGGGDGGISVLDGWRWRGGGGTLGSVGGASGRSPSLAVVAADADHIAMCGGWWEA